MFLKLPEGAEPVVASKSFEISKPVYGVSPYKNTYCSIVYIWIVVFLTNLDILHRTLFAKMFSTYHQIYVKVHNSTIWPTSASMLKQMETHSATIKVDLSKGILQNEQLCSIADISERNTNFHCAPSTKTIFDRIIPFIHLVLFPESLVYCPNISPFFIVACHTEEQSATTGVPSLI